MTRRHQHAPPSGDAPRRRRRRWVARTAAAVAIGLLLLPVAILLLRNPLAKRYLPRLLGRQLGMKLRFAEVSISLGGTVVLQGVQGSDPEDDTIFRELRADEIRARVSVPDVLRDGLDAIRAVAVRGGVLSLDLDRPRSAPAEREEPHRERGAFDWPELLPQLDVEMLRLAIESGGDRLRFEDLSLVATPRHRVERRQQERDASPLSLESRLLWKLDRREGSGALTLSLDFRDGRVSDLQVSIDGAERITGGDFDLARLEGGATLHLGRGGGIVRISGLRRGPIDVTASLSEAPVEDVLGFLLWEESPVQGTLSFEARARLPSGDPLRGSASIDLWVREAAIESVPLHALHVAASMEDRRLRIHALEGEILGVSVDSQGLRASLENLETSALLASVSGELRVRSPDVGRAVSALTGEAALEALAAGGALEAGIRAAEGLAIVEALDLVGPSLRIHLDAARLELDPASPEESRWFAVGRAFAAEIGAVADAVGAEAAHLRGALDVQFALRGSVASPEGEAILRGEGIEAAGVALGEVRSDVKLDRDAASVRWLDITSHSEPPFEMSVSGSLRLRDRWIEDAKLSAQGEGLRERIRALAGSDFLLPEGDLRIRAAASGPIGWPDGSLEIAGPATGAGRRRAAAFLRKREDAVTLSADSLPLGALAVSVDAGGTISRDLESGEITLASLRLERADQKEPPWRNAEEARIRFDAVGRRLAIDPPLVLTDGAGRVSASLRPAATGDAPEAAVAAISASIPGRLPFWARAGGVDAQDVSLGLTARLPPEWSAPDDLLFPASVKLHAHAGELVLPFAAAQAEIDLRVDRSGTQPSGELSVRVPRLNLTAIPGGHELEESLPGWADVLATWDGRIVRVDSLLSELGGVRIDGGGTAELRTRVEADPSRLRAFVPGRLDLLLVADVLDFRLAQMLVPDIRRLEGNLRLDARVRGTLDDPQAEGSLRLRDILLRVGEAPSLSSLDAVLALRGADLDVERLTGEVGGAPVIVTGSIRDVFRSPRFDLHGEGRNVLLARSADVRVRGDASLHLGGALSSPALTGSVEITGGQVTRDVDLLNFRVLLRRPLRRVAEIGAPEARRPGVPPPTGGFQPFALREPPLSRVRFEVSVAARRPILLQGNLLDGRVRPDVLLLGTGEVPYLVGIVYVDDFVLALPTSRLRVDSGLVRFDERNPFAPELHFVGVTRMLGYDVNVVVSGPAHEPDIELSSNPPLTTEQIALLLTTGRQPGEVATSDQAAFLNVATFLGSDLMRKLFGDGDVAATSESILERFEIEAGRNPSRLGTTQTWEARFRLRNDVVFEDDSLYLVAERDAFDHYNVGLRIVVRGR